MKTCIQCIYCQEFIIKGKSLASTSKDGVEFWSLQDIDLLQCHNKQSQWYGTYFGYDKPVCSIFSGKKK